MGMGALWGLAVGNAGAPLLLPFVISMDEQEASPVGARECCSHPRAASLDCQHGLGSLGCNLGWLALGRV